MLTRIYFIIIEGSLGTGSFAKSEVLESSLAAIVRQLPTIPVLPAVLSGSTLEKVASVDK
jgi:hypothetical protein